jgi:hypothetical protein
MRVLILACSLLFVSTFVVVSAECQENTSSSQPANNDAVEGTVIFSACQ